MINEHFDTKDINDLVMMTFSQVKAICNTNFSFNCCIFFTTLG